MVILKKYTPNNKIIKVGSERSLASAEKKAKRLSMETSLSHIVETVNADGEMVQHKKYKYGKLVKEIDKRS